VKLLKSMLLKQSTPSWVLQHFLEEIRIVEVIHNIYIERIMCTYKGSVCFLLCTQVLQ